MTHCLRLKRRLATFIVAVFLAVLSTACFADHGGCPCVSDSAPNPIAEIAEPAQRAVILWNGREEWLILATDAAVVSGNSQSTVEFIPLPSEPLSQVESADLIRRTVAWGGAHGLDLSGFTGQAPPGHIVDNPFTISIQRPTNLADTLVKVCPIAPSYSAGATALAERYVGRGLSWFAIDRIDVDKTLKSFPPISYRFASDRVFYPLETSAMGVGETRIDIVLITPSGISSLGSDGNFLDPGSVTLVRTESLATVSSDWPTLFSQDVVAVQHVVIKGALSELRFDLFSKPDGLAAH
ncbi:MAG TPA: hypothetical protein VH082_10910 [Rudaea sp.]|jgi:hypothetical protein|nr:hypothetical protein [Rudaea sp.]